MVEWSRLPGSSTGESLDYWAYFGMRLVKHASISPGANILDIGCGNGSSLFPAAAQIGESGYAIGIDICPCPG